ncbi:gamma-glutamylcyclotransferase family protein [Halorussus amylolyticus]|uniref:gamma-glutamylcyclotransferase family protein n=1 Tax=Halorussus amylolyticus TaxID=1126242 RepID=UPI001046B841|nr:gamma-glutamylcyclotransferase family protein [Halorussus amylolyticus]
MDAFVYGTLTDPAQVARIVSEFEFGDDAILDGLHRIEGEYPTLAPGGSVSGRILRTPDVAALDAYEGVDSGLYVRVSVPREDAKVRAENADEVEVYVGDPDSLGADAEWPGTGSFAERVRRVVRERGVTVRTCDPRGDVSR